MPQTDYSRSHDYEMPPALLFALVHGTTWGLHCRDCGRQIAVDVIKLVEGVADVRDFNAGKTFARASCKDCGGRMRNHRGYEVAALQHLGRLPRLVTGDGSDWRRPACLKPAPGQPSF